MDLPPSAKHLLALPPSRFTRERNALASALAARRDGAAATVRRLPRPIGLAWVLNRLALERPRDVAALVEAGDRVRAGQRRAVAGAGAGELRAAEDELRERARALRIAAEPILAGEGRPAPAATLGRLELLLRVAATGPSREPFREGVLPREPALGSGELSGFTVLAGGARGPLSPTPSSAARGRGDPAPPARQARDATRRETQARRKRERAIAKARAAAAAARARAEREERAAAVAERRARGARERAAAARRDADRRAAELAALERGG